MKIIKSPSESLSEKYEALKNKYSGWQPEIACGWCKAVLRVSAADLIHYTDLSPDNVEHNCVGVVCPCCKQNIRVHAPIDLAFFIMINHIH